MSASPSGWALRTTGSCAFSDVYCSTTIDPYVVCCPDESYCAPQYNAVCCPDPSNCTDALIRSPKCADETWDLYDNRGYFCCEQGFMGYSTPYNSDGCAMPGYTLDAGEEYLPIIVAGKSPNSFTDFTTSFPSATEINPGSYTSHAYSYPHGGDTNDDGSTQQSPVGIIVGAVTGGIVALAIIGASIFLIARKLSKSKGAQPLQTPGPGYREKPLWR